MAQIDLGSVKLNNGPHPEIVQAFFAESFDRNKLTFTVHNKLDRELFVAMINVSQNSSFPASHCEEASSVRYEIEGQAELRGIVKDRLDIDARLHSDGDRVFYQTIQGEVQRGTCGGPYTIRLAIPVSFTVPAERYQNVVIVLPKRLSVVKQGPTDLAFNARSLSDSDIPAKVDPIVKTILGRQ